MSNDYNASLNGFEENDNTDMSEDDLLLFPTISLNIKDLKVINSIKIENFENNFDRVKDVRVLNIVYKTIKCLTIRRDFVTYNEIASKTFSDFGMERKETGLCIEILHFEGTISSVQINFTNYFQIKNPKCKNYIQFFNGKITSLLMYTICELYLERNHSIQKKLIRFSINELTDSFINCNPIWPRIKINGFVVAQWIVPLISRGYLSRLDCGLEITLATIKYGIKKKYLKSSDWPTDIIKPFVVNRMTIQAPKINTPINKNIFNSVENLSGYSVFEMTSNFPNSGNHISQNFSEILRDENDKQVLSCSYNMQPDESCLTNNVTCCVCMKGEINQIQTVQCRRCLIYGHTSCIQFHNYSNFSAYCVNCRKYFNESESQEFLCDICITQYTNNTVCDLCNACKYHTNNMIPDQVEILERSKNIIDNHDFFGSINDENQLTNPSFVEMLNEKEISSFDICQPTKYLFNWTVNDVSDWFKHKGYENVAKIFMDQEIDGHSLSLLLESDLELLNLNSDIIKEILNKINVVKK